MKISHAYMFIGLTTFKKDHFTKAIYRFNSIPIKKKTHFILYSFTKTYPKIHMESQKIHYSQNNPEEKE